MIVDLRIYTCKPNKMNEWIAMYKEMAWPLQQKYLGRCVGWFTTVEGELNTIVHVWAYEDQGDRERRRNAMAADPEWQKLRSRPGLSDNEIVANISNVILRPLPFSAIS